MTDTVDGARSTPPTVTLDDIEQARGAITPVLGSTPVFSSSRLGRQVGARLHHKAELLQKTGSFKPRGALNRVHHTPPADLERGVIAVSGGNHAQGIAFAASRAGVPSLVVMPEDVAPVKAAATRSYGAEVVLHGDVNEAYAKVEELRRERGMTFIHPFDDPHVVAGQGTVGLEIAEQVPDASVVVVPVGGGGLIAGIAIAIKELLGTHVRVIGVEPEGADPMRVSRTAGHPVRLDEVDSLVLSLAAPMVGATPFEIAQRYVDDVVTVTRQEIRSGLRALMTATKLFAEPGGAAATGALLAGKVEVSPDDVVVSVVSGGNTDWDELQVFIQGDGF